MNFNQLEWEIEQEFAKSNWRIGGETYRSALMQKESVRKWVGEEILKEVWRFWEKNKQANEFWYLGLPFPCDYKWLRSRYDRLVRAADRTDGQ